MSEGLFIYFLIFRNFDVARKRPATADGPPPGRRQVGFDILVLIIGSNWRWLCHCHWHRHWHCR